MSVAEIKAELPKLTPAELIELEVALMVAKQQAPESKPSDFFGRMRGTMKFNPGWDEPDTELWDALKDDSSL